MGLAWVPLAEWVLGEALRSIDGHEGEAATALERAADDQMAALLGNDGDLRGDKAIRIL